MRIAYLLYNERPLSGLVRGQVMEPMAALQRRRPDWQITIIAVWQPWVAIVQRDAIKRMGEQLRAEGIALENRSLALIPSRLVMDYGFTLPFALWFNRLTFALLGLDRFDVVQPRGYLASGVIAMGGSRRFGLVFDPRSLFPEEWVTTGRWTLESSTYKRWKRLEADVMATADAVTGMSEAMTKELKALRPKGPVHHVPLATNPTRRFDADARARWRDRHGLDDRFVMAFQGTLGLSWQGNNVETYAAYLPSMRRAIPHLHCLFVVPKVLPEFAGCMTDGGARPEEFSFIEGDAEIVQWLSAADAGLHVMRVGPDAATRFGVKVVEYLMMGLPVITNSGAGAAATFVEANDAGIRLDLEDLAFETRLHAFANRSYDRETLRQIAMTTFSSEAIAKKYEQIYEEIAKARRVKQSS